MLRYVLAVFLLFHGSMQAFADAEVPKADAKGSVDHGLVGRFQGSFIVSYAKKEFDEVTFPLSPLKPVEGKTDGHNNTVFQPEQAKSLEGRRTRLVYLNPAGASSLEVIRNYEKELQKKEGKVLYSCAKNECGGSDTRGSSGGGGEMSLAMYLWPEDAIREKHFSNGHCAQTSRISDQRYMVIELPQKGAIISVQTYLLNDDLYCKAFNDRTIAIVDIMEVRQMQEKMVTIKAEEMAEAISKNGSVALYGIYFDFNKADVKPESDQTLQQIARLLAQDAQLKLLVVGHTDNVGNYGTNADLSKKRAEAVVHSLASAHGIAKDRLQAVGVSFACPVATNATDEGRAKNRRVELVKF